MFVMGKHEEARRVERVKYALGLMIYMNEYS
jgi:hypothetical protein